MNDYNTLIKLLKLACDNDPNYCIEIFTDDSGGLLHWGFQENVFVWDSVKDGIKKCEDYLKA